VGDDVAEWDGARNDSEGLTRSAKCEVRRSNCERDEGTKGRRREATKGSDGGAFRTLNFDL